MSSFFVKLALAVDVEAVVASAAPRLLQEVAKINIVVIWFNLHVLHFAIVVLRHEFFDGRRDQLALFRSMHIELIKGVETVDVLVLLRTRNLPLEADVQDLDRAKRRRHVLVRQP